MKTLENKLEELLDREAIRDLPQRYCDAIWREDAEAAAEMFTEDGILSAVGSAGTAHLVQGREAMLEAYGQLGANGGPRPFCHQVVIDEIGPDRAKGKAYVEVRLGNDKMDYWSTSVYYDEYQKVNGTWKFSKRHCLLHEHRPMVK